jgi:hypothetical protein
MNQTVPLKLRISRRAEARLRQRSEPLLFEMEIYFSCLIRKRVYVRVSAEGIETIPVNDRLKIRFRPVVTRTCAISECERDNPPVVDMPIVDPGRYFPRWLTLDYRAGQWRAEFGYAGILA